MTDPHVPTEAASVPITSGTQFLLLIFRSFGAFAVLFGCLILLLRRPAWTLSMVDVVFWGVAMLMLFLLARAQRGNADARQGRLVLAKTAAVTLLLWVGAQSVQLIP